MARPGWNTLAPGLRAALVALAAVESALLLAAQIDITRRPAKGVAGSKGAWRLISLVELVGPIAYFVFGRADPKRRRRRARPRRRR
jgi:Phospholipase_D-nuclease N-terminal